MIARMPNPSYAAERLDKSLFSSSTASQLNLRVARLIGNGVRNQKCEAPFGPFGFWFLPPFPRTMLKIGCDAALERSRGRLVRAD
jgi:hypothetical protein